MDQQQFIMPRTLHDIRPSVQTRLAGRRGSPSPPSPPWRMDPTAPSPMHALTFHGSLAELQALVASLGVPCHWEHKGPFELAVFDDPASNLKLNWWPATGVLELVGDPEIRVGMEQRLAAALAGPAAG